MAPTAVTETSASRSGNSSTSETEVLTDCRCEFDSAWALTVYITWVTLAIYAIPIAALVSVYSRICLAVWRSERFNRAASRARARRSTPRHDDSLAESVNGLAGRRRSSRYRGGGGDQALSTTVSTAKVKTVKLTMVVVASYIVCYGPFFVAQMWAAWDFSAPFQETPMVIIMLLASLNSCVNPWIYLSFNDHVTMNQGRSHYHERGVNHFTKRKGGQPRDHEKRERRDYETTTCHKGRENVNHVTRKEMTTM